MVAAGESPGVDQVRGHLVVLGRRDELEQARAAQSVAEHALKMLIGFDFDRPVVVTALSDPTNELQAFHPEGVLKRNELVQFAAQQRAGEQEVREARSELRPQLTYSLNLGPDTNSLGSGLYQHTGLAGGIFLNVPLSDGGISRAHEKQAQLRQDLVESQRQLALRQFAQQYSDAFSQAQSAAARVPLTRAGLAQAEQDVDVSEARYRAGEATVIEVTDAQARLAVQRAAVNQARYDYQIAVTHLRQAVGP
jgi:outer membrane protein TolC